MNRRTLLKRSLAVSAIGVAASAGLLAPGQVLAAYPKAAFQAKDSSAALNDLLGSSNSSESGDIKIKAPDIAENGAVVPVTVSSGISGVESITLLADTNATPLLGSFDLSNAEPFISTRIKMGKTGNVVAVVKAGGKLYSSKKEVKVTIGGCGG
jgi:sulfur-oxidizing protein SoxY